MRRAHALTHGRERRTRVLARRRCKGVVLEWGRGVFEGGGF